MIEDTSASTWAFDRINGLPMARTTFLPHLVVATVTAIWLGCSNGSTRAPAIVNAWNEATSQEERLRILFQSGEHNADVMQLVMPRRVVEVAEKMVQYVQNKPISTIAKVLVLDEGEPIPYDPQMGITEEEYEDFLRMRDQMNMQKLREGKVLVTTGDDTMLSIQLPTTLLDHGLLKLDAKSGTIETPFGKVTDPSEVSRSEGPNAIGPWNGYSWRSGVVAQLFGNFIRVVIGQRVETGQVVIIYHVRDFYEGTDVVDVTVFILDPPRR